MSLLAFQASSYATGQSESYPLKQVMKAQIPCNCLFDLWLGHTI